jgi:MFS family permease
MGETSRPVVLGLRENLSQFSLLVLVNAFVGAMVGMERSILPAFAEEEFNLVARTAIFSFIMVFGITKATANYFAGRWSDAWGRKAILVGGWLVAAPVPFLLIWAPSWNWVLFANLLLGASQGLTWSTTVIMKIDLVGPERRGLAMGINEFAGYFALGAAALGTGWLAASYGLRPQPFYLGIGFVVAGLLLSVFAVQETKHHVEHESTMWEAPPEGLPTQREVFWQTSLFNKDLSSVSQTGLVNNLNDGMAWGAFPLFFAAAGMSLREIGTLTAIYPAVWGIGQLFTGALSDRVGRKWLIVTGMWIQAVGIATMALSSSFTGFAGASALLGTGTAMVYPTLLAAIGDVAHPQWRASAVGVYRLWRDLGYALGALLAGLIADRFNLAAAIWTVAALTFASGTLTALRMSETRGQPLGP